MLIVIEKEHRSALKHSWSSASMRGFAVVAGCLCAVASAFAQEVNCVNAKANHIIMNGDDWSGLRKELSDKSQWPGGKFNIVQLGDSHIQPDVIGSEVRRRLQYVYGNGGRGLVAADAIAGTNQPSDYSFTTSGTVLDKARLIGNFELPVGVTGIAVKLDTLPHTLSIATDSAFATSKVALLHSAEATGFDTARVDGDTVIGTKLGPWATQYSLASQEQHFSLGIGASGCLYGAYLLNNEKGIVYSSIGNNGATYNAYCNVANMGEQLRIANPQLIIVSLGTNEAVGNVSDALGDYISQLLSELSKSNPTAKFLLTTPMECRATKGRRRHGIAGKAMKVRNAILEYGRKQRVPVWDLYAVAGGEGACGKWQVAGLMQNDGLHCTISGYELQGMLLADALLERLEIN